VVPTKERVSVHLQVSGESQYDKQARAAEQWNLPAHWIQKIPLVALADGNETKRAKTQRAEKHWKGFEADVLRITRQ
jgi:hypothetical protein